MAFVSKAPLSSVRHIAFPECSSSWKDADGPFLTKIVPSCYVDLTFQAIGRTSTPLLLLLLPLNTIQFGNKSFPNAPFIEGLWRIDNKLGASLNFLCVLLYRPECKCSMPPISCRSYLRCSKKLTIIVRPFFNFGGRSSKRLEIILCPFRSLSSFDYQTQEIDIRRNTSVMGPQANPHNRSTVAPISRDTM